MRKKKLSWKLELGDARQSFGSNPLFNEYVLFLLINCKGFVVSLYLSII